MSFIDILNLAYDSFFKLLMPGLALTIPLTLISFSLAMILAIIVALIQFSNVKVLKQICKIYIWIIRGTPLLVQLFVVFYGLPYFGITLDKFSAAIITFTLNGAAYCSETIRGALESISKGQIEAGYCVGMNYFQIIYKILIPQALRICFPSLANSIISMVKDTSLASNITIMEMFLTAKQIVGRTYQPLLIYVEVALIYLLFCTVLTFLQNYLEQKLNKKGAIKY